MSYELRITPHAERDLGALDSVPYQTVKRKIYSLKDDPRPPGCRKLSNYDAWRLRAGDYRIVYEIDDRARLVTIMRVGHRKDIYR